FRFTTRVCTSPIDLIVNGGFEEGFDGWTLIENGRPPVLTTEEAHSGNYSARLGVTGPGGGNHELYQTITIPAEATNPRLVFWFKPAGSGPFCIFSSCEERDAVVIRPEEPDRPIYIWRDLSPAGDWMRREFSLEDFKGETVELHFLARSISLPSAHTGIYLDDVSLDYELCGPGR